MLALWRLSRPETWMVSLLPMLIGHVLATRTLLPGLELWTGFLDQAVTEGATFTAFLEILVDWWTTASDLVVAAVVMGPALWLPTLLWNDLHDMESDRRNPRKARSPLLQGLVGRGLAWRASLLGAGACLGLAALVGPWFLAVVAAQLVLAWLYSVPPVRLKTVPGADVAVNAVGVGFLAALAGWTIAAPLAGFPWLLVPQGLLVAVAVYVPTTLVDREADAASGYLTLATHLGTRRAYRIGWWAWVGAQAGAVLLSAADHVLPRAMLPVLLVFTPILLIQYHIGVGRARDGPEMAKGVVLCSFTFLAVNMVFVLMHTGIWKV